jgi:protoheme ferro-lyase
MVFMNMGGPSTTGEVYDFLARLFVRPYLLYASMTSKD